MFIEYFVLSAIIVFTFCGAMMIWGLRIKARKFLLKLSNWQGALTYLSAELTLALETDNRRALQYWQKGCKYAAIVSFLAMVIFQFVNVYYSVQYPIAVYIVMLLAMLSVAGVGRCSMELGKRIGVKQRLLAANDKDIDRLKLFLAEHKIDNSIHAFTSQVEPPIRKVHIDAFIYQHACVREKNKG